MKYHMSGVSETHIQSSEGTGNSCSAAEWWALLGAVLPASQVLWSSPLGWDKASRISPILQMKHPRLSGPCLLGPLPHGSETVHVPPFLFIFSFDSTWVWTQDLAFARQALSIWAMPLALFALVIFQIGSRDFCLWLALDHDPTTCASWVAGMTGTYCHTQLVCLGWHLGNFFVLADFGPWSSQVPFLYRIKFWASFGLTFQGCLRLIP
jgi:hypothetical protein